MLATFHGFKDVGSGTPSVGSRVIGYRTVSLHVYRQKFRAAAKFFLITGKKRGNAHPYICIRTYAFNLYAYIVDCGFGSLTVKVFDGFFVVNG